MRLSASLLVAIGATALIATGCSGPEKKLGRGINNVTEFTRMGELRRSMEQSVLWEGTEVAYTRGFFRGLNRTMARTVVGAFEVLTFPFPGYEPYLKPGNTFFPDMAVDPVYPDNYRPHALSDSTFDADSTLGFGGGDVMPFIPGSRFRIFDY